MTDLPNSLIRYRAELELAAGRDLSRRRRRVRVVRPVAVLGALGAAAGIAFVIAAGGGPSIVDRAEAAIAAGSGDLLHIRMLGRTTTNGRVVQWADEEWIVSGSVSPRRAVETTPDGRRFESAMTENGLAEFYDPASNTIYAEPVLPPSGPKPSDAESAGLARRTLSPQEQIKLLLAGGQLEDDGHASVDGRDAIRLVGQGGNLQYFVDPDTYVPIELRVTRDGGETDLRFPVYEPLPPSARGNGLFSLRAQHPGAAVKIDAKAYEERWAELAPPKP